MPEKSSLQKRKEFWIDQLQGYNLDVDNGASWHFSKKGTWFVNVNRSTLKPNECVTITYRTPDEHITGPWHHNAHIVFDYKDNEEPTELKAVIYALINPEKLPLCLGINESMDNFIGFYMKAMNLEDDYELREKEYQDFLKDELKRSYFAKIFKSFKLLLKRSPVDGNKIS